MKINIHYSNRYFRIIHIVQRPTFQWLFQNTHKQYRALLECLTELETWAGIMPNRVFRLKNCFFSLHYKILK